jgi:hypothetical protein
LRQTFEEAVQTQLYPRSRIDISVLVLEQDGGMGPERVVVMVGVLIVVRGFTDGD